MASAQGAALLGPDHMLLLSTFASLSSIAVYLSPSSAALATVRRGRAPANAAALVCATRPRPTFDTNTNARPSLPLDANGQIVDV